MIEGGLNTGSSGRVSIENSENVETERSQRGTPIVPTFLSGVISVSNLMTSVLTTTDVFLCKGGRYWMSSLHGVDDVVDDRGTEGRGVTGEPTDMSRRVGSWSTSGCRDELND